MRFKPPQRRMVNLVGLKGSGMTSASKYLEQNYGFKRVDPLAIVAKAYPDALASPQNYNRCQRELLAGKLEALTMAIMRRTGNVCIDGLLIPSQAQKLQDRLGDNFATIAFDCHPEIRAKHLRENPQGSAYDIGISAQRLTSDEAAAFYGTGELDINVPGVMEMHTDRGAQLDTNCSLPRVRMRLEAALGQLGFALTQS